MEDSRHSFENESESLEKESEEEEKIQSYTSSYQINIKEEKNFLDYYMPILSFPPQICPKSYKHRIRRNELKKSIYCNHVN